NIQNTNYLIHCRKLHLYQLKHDLEYTMNGETAAIAYNNTIQNEYDELYKTFFMLTGLLGKYDWVKYFEGDINEIETAKKIVRDDVLNILYGTNFNDLIAKRIKNILNESQNFEWKKKEDYVKEYNVLFDEVHKRFIDGFLHKIKNNETEFFDNNPYDVEAIEKVIDKIIY